LVHLDPRRKTELCKAGFRLMESFDAEHGCCWTAIFTV
jgi:hypothetical protein